MCILTLHSVLLSPPPWLPPGWVGVACGAPFPALLPVWPLAGVAPVGGLRLSACGAPGWGLAGGVAPPCPPSGPPSGFGVASGIIVLVLACCPCGSSYIAFVFSNELQSLS